MLIKQSWRIVVCLNQKRDEGAGEYRCVKEQHLKERPGQWQGWLTSEVGQHSGIAGVNYYMY